MLIGEYKHTLDSKKRVALPAKFRKLLGKRVVITKGLDNCLFIYPTGEWKKMSEKLNTLSMGRSDSRGVNRFFVGGATETDIDSLGRVLIPDYLKEFAKLGSKVVIIGVNQRVEVWNERYWKEYKGRVEKEADTLAEKLGEIGGL